MNKKPVLKKDELDKKVKWEELIFNLSSGTWKGWTYKKDKKGDKDERIKGKY